jgi:hypothetical protein
VGRMPTIPFLSPSYQFVSICDTIEENCNYTEKKENEISLIYNEIQRDQSYMATASSYMVKKLHVSSYIEKPFLIYDFVPDPI